MFLVSSEKIVHDISGDKSKKIRLFGNTIL